MAAIAGLSAVVAVVALSWLAFTQGGLLFDPVYPSLALVAIYLATSLSTYVKSELDRAYVRQAFGHYVAPQLVEQLADNAGSLKLGGETREVTLLFSDVRGFSRISEGLDAEGLVRFINELFTPIADVILEERGTIDKFMGDAVMAFWNAPVADDNHARHACRAALAHAGGGRRTQPAAGGAGVADRRSVRAGAHRHRAQHRALRGRQRRFAAAIRLLDPG